MSVGRLLPNERVADKRAIETGWGVCYCNHGMFWHDTPDLHCGFIRCGCLRFYEAEWSRQRTRSGSVAEPTTPSPFLAVAERMRTGLRLVLLDHHSPHFRGHPRPFGAWNCGDATCRLGSRLLGWIP